MARSTSLAWLPPHTLAYVAGRGRETWRDKTLRVWSPESGACDVTAPGEVGLAPAWDAPRRRLYFVRAPAGANHPEDYFNGRSIGARRLTVMDLQTGTRRELPRDEAFAEEGVRVAHDGSLLIVIRRPVTPYRSLQELAYGPTDTHLPELWAMRPDGTAARPLLRLARLPYYGLLSAFDTLAWSR